MDENGRDEEPFIDQLRCEGYEVICASEANGCPADNAIRLLRSGAQFDLIVTNNVMATRDVPEFLGGDRQGWDVGLRLLELARQEGYKGAGLILDVYPGLSYIQDRIQGGKIHLSDGSIVWVVDKTETTPTLPDVVGRALKVNKTIPSLPTEPAGP